VYYGKIDIQKLDTFNYSDGISIPSSVIELADAEVLHIVKVKRHSIDDIIDIVDGEGIRVTSRITSIIPLDFEVLNVVHEVCEKYITVVIPLLKSDRMTQAVENAIELGATNIIFWQANRSIAKWTDEKSSQKSIEKMQNLIIKSSKQSRRAHFPVILGVFNSKKLFAYLDTFTNMRLVVLHEQATEHIANLSHKLSDFTILIVGPEGGITDVELLGFRKLQADICKISSNVLRSATAISAGLAVIYNLSKTD
jgi:16S rRNA (uracil1498-N3)-methyltransferase